MCVFERNSGTSASPRQNVTLQGGFIVMRLSIGMGETELEEGVSEAPAVYWEAEGAHVCPAVQVVCS